MKSSTKPSMAYSKKYYDFINKYRVTEKNVFHTHTRITGGKFNIPDDVIEQFYELYYNHVIINKNEETMTEVQLKDGRSPILIDLDLRYDIEIDRRQHDEELPLTVIEIYMEQIKKIVDLQSDIMIPIYLFQKPNVNIDTENNRTKDGLHLIIGLQLEHKYQIELRKMVLDEIKTNSYDELNNLPITNSWETILDETICRGTTNWQMYGSNKPNNQKYSLINIWNVSFEEHDGEILYTEVELPKTNDEKKDIFRKLSAQYCGHPFFPINSEFKDKLENSNKNTAPRRIRRLKSSKDKLVLSTSGDYSDVTCKEQLDIMIEEFLVATTDVCCEEHSFRDIYMYVMILPEEYYKDYDKWIQVGWALKNVDFRMFIVWMRFSCQWCEFSFDDISERFEQWQNFNEGDDCKTKGSIVYWAREYWYNVCRDDPNAVNKFDEIYKSSIDYYVQKSIDEPEDYNFAMVLFKMYGDKFKCSDIKNNTWYQFINNRWVEMNNATSLYLNISTKQYQLYNTKLMPYVNRLQTIEDEDDPEWNETKKRIGTLRKICDRLKNTTSKEKIIKESKHLFYDKDFFKLLDSNPNLFGCKNGIIDFSNNTFRKGNRDDYISMTTNLNYIPKDKWDPTIVQQINNYMYQLFPEKELYTYMWEYLGSIPIGKDLNQTFNNFHGKGQNGKSKFIEILSALLGDYYSVVPGSYITGKRSSVEGTQSSIAKLKGVRFACINEPQEDEQINEGIMKELTGGDEIQARQLYRESFRFKPQFKLAVATNHLYKINSQDDGTWRRFRIVPFVSRFVVKSSLGIRYSWEENPHQFEIDYQLDNKLASKNFKDTFISMMIEKTFETGGVVKDVPSVLNETDKYRNGQDFFSSFINEKILVEEGCGNNIRKQELHNEFQEWYKQNIGGKPPKSSKLYDLMDKRFGTHNRKMGWRNVKIIYENDGDDDDDDDDI